MINLINFLNIIKIMSLILIGISVICIWFLTIINGKQIAIAFFLKLLIPSACLFISTIMTNFVFKDFIDTQITRQDTEYTEQSNRNPNEPVDNVSEQEIIFNSNSDDDSEGHNKTTGLLIGIFCIVIALLIMILLYKSYKKKDIEKTEKTEKSNETSKKID